MGRTGYPFEFRRRALDLVVAGKPVTDVACDFDIGSKSIYHWQRQDRIDEGLEPRATSAAALGALHAHS